MENTEKLLKEIKEKMSSLQSSVSKLEKALKEDDIKSKKSVVLETPVEKSVVENTEVPEQSPDLELPKLETSAEPVLEKTEEERITSEEVKEETPSLTETIEEKSIEETNRTFIAGFKSSSSNLVKIKGHFNSDKLQAIISVLENDKIEKVAMSELEEGVQPDLSMPSDLINPVEETPVENKSEVVNGSVLDKKTNLVNPVVEEKRINSEDVAENLANNFGDEKRMRTVEEMLKEMELKLGSEGKGR